MKRIINNEQILTYIENNNSRLNEIHFGQVFYFQWPFLCFHWQFFRRNCKRKANTTLWKRNTQTHV